jgi:hypothetical protein
LSEGDLCAWFENLPVLGFDIVLALGLRYFSSVQKTIIHNLKKRLYPGFLCQIYDGSRLDNDDVDITFTLKNHNIHEEYKFGSAANRYVRHRAFNDYIGWAADSELNIPLQSDQHLQFLVDHTNYGDNPVDLSDDILSQIRDFVNSEIWKNQWKSVIVRRFDSGKIVTVDLNDQSLVKRYDRTSIPFREVCAEHSRCHVFFVTHPESVGLVVLETSMAGALTVTPKKFISSDRLNKVRHIEYSEKINWVQVLDSIDPLASREKALKNSWELVAQRMLAAVRIRQLIRLQQHD